MKRIGPNWLSSAVFYQIYPQSFYDGNGDGIGDISGITAKLDYLQYLGCDAVWINPCFASPFYDAGYDVSDYYKVAARYGTNADLKRLFREAAKRGIRICLDLVPGHTSIEHPWFKQSCRAEKNKYSDYYIWTDDWTKGGTSGLDAIRGFGQRNGNYINNFFWSQPALNYGFAEPDPTQPWQLPIDHPGCRAVRGEMIKVMRYWLDMGASGFRVDMASSLIKNDPGKKRTSELWQEVRAMLDNDYPEAVLISEWSDPKTAIKAGFHVDFILGWNNTGYTSLFRQEKDRDTNPDTNGHSFFDKQGKGNIETFIKAYLEHYRRVKRRGYISLVTGNHDLPRISIRRTQKELELVFAFILTMPGVPFIYYGDEIGMKYLKELPCKEGGYIRSGSRTPMQWNFGKNAGFSRAPAGRLYLPIDKSKNRHSVQAQQYNSNSLLNKVRRLINLRRRHRALGADGGFVPIYAQPKKYPFVYLRCRGREKILIAINPSKRNVKATFPSDKCHTIELLTRCCDVSLSQKNHLFLLKMGPISYAIFKI